MDIELNGEPRSIDAQATLKGLLDQCELAGKRIAVEVNEEIVPRSSYAEYQLREGDRVEIVHAIGGG